MSVLLHPQGFSIFSNSRSYHDNQFTQLLIAHAIHKIVAELLLNMLLNQQASFGGFRFPPYTPPRPNQFIPQPKFFDSMPRQTPNVEHAQYSKSRATASAFVEQASNAVNGIQDIAEKFDSNGKIQKERQAVEQNLHAFQQANNAATVQETHDQLKTSLNRLVRRLGLLVHPDKNPSPEATEAFKQLHELRDQFDNAQNSASQ